jgi:hypothetical protein
MTHVIIELVKAINKNEYTDIDTITQSLLYSIYTDDVKNLSLLYRLIFHAYKRDPLCSYHILSGFVKFGQSTDGNKYKPLLDHLAIEAFDKLIEIGGWSILRDCINILRDTLTNLITEPIFLHILSRITKQLYADEHESENPDNLSDICHYLPREKSFTWGWFAFCIIAAYYSPNEQKISNKLIRKYLMHYRKLLTSLRRVVPQDDPNKDVAVSIILTETWRDILTELDNSEYTWAADLINILMESTKPYDMDRSITYQTMVDVYDVDVYEVDVDEVDVYEVDVDEVDVRETSARETSARETSARETSARETSALADAETNNYLEQVSEKLQTLSDESFEIVSDETVEKKTITGTTGTCTTGTSTTGTSTTGTGTTEANTTTGGWFSWLGWS